jgi:hypothetical protein
MFENAKWILHPENKLYEPVSFIREIKAEKKIKKATLNITALGVYYAEIDGYRVGDFILAPGFTSRRRVQYQSYDITSLVKDGSVLSVSVAEGWYKGKINFGADEGGPEKKKSLMAQIDIVYADNTKERIVTDTAWQVRKDMIRYAELYDGEIVDANYTDAPVSAVVYENPPYVKVVKDIAAKEGSGVVVISAKIEEELGELSPEDREMFLEDLGIESAGLDQMINASYSLLGLISFLTAGPKEVRAWTIKKGTKAPQAAGKIHSDFERGFIRAEVVAYDDLIANGTYNAAKEKGLVRSEGKEYVMKDGDVVVFRFNV